MTGGEFCILFSMTPPASNPVPALQGKFVIDVLREGHYRTITFKQPMEVEWYVVSEESTHDRIYAEAVFPNEMRFPLVFTRTSPMPGGRFDEMTVPSIEKAVREALCFDFMHAFFHPSMDPNYGIAHWALYGNFKDDVVAVELDDLGDEIPG